MIYEILKELNIKYKEYRHPAVYTCEESDKYHQNSDAGRSKNLFLRNKNGDKYYLIILESKKKVNLKELSVLLDEKKLAFASSEKLLKYLNLTAGSVSPFGLINDIDKEVVVIVDKDLLKYEKVGYHPNINTATLIISIDDFKKYLQWTGNTIVYLDI